MNARTDGDYYRLAAAAAEAMREEHGVQMTAVQRHCVISTLVIALKMGGQLTCRLAAERAAKGSN